MSPSIVDVQVFLPEDWWTIPLIDPALTEEAVRALVERQCAVLPVDAPLRADLHRQTIAQTDQARAGGGRLLAISLQTVAEVPLPAALVVHWVDLPPHPAGAGGHLMDLQDELRPAPGVEPPPGWTLDLARLEVGAVLRRVQVHTGTPSSVVADYWIERPDGAGIVQLAFATPMVALREPMLELFDAIAGGLRWAT